MLAPRPTSKRLRVLEHRLVFLRASADSLQTLAEEGERILSADSMSERPALLAFPIRASIVAMVCATIEGFLQDLVNETKKVLGLDSEPGKPLRGSALNMAKDFFKNSARLAFPDQTKVWIELTALVELRHSLVHVWGQIDDVDRRKAVENLQSVKISEAGEVNLTADVVTEALRIMREFADELQTHMGGTQGITNGA